MYAMSTADPVPPTKDTKPIKSPPMLLDNLRCFCSCCLVLSVCRRRARDGRRVVRLVGLGKATACLGATQRHSMRDSSRQHTPQERQTEGNFLLQIIELPGSRQRSDIVLFDNKAFFGAMLFLLTLEFVDCLTRVRVLWYLCDRSQPSIHR